MTLNLTVHNSIHRQEPYTACNGFVWWRNGQYYAESNSTDVAVGGSDNWGCDSVLHLQLTVNGSVRVDTFATVCDAVVWRGIERTESGDYYHYSGGTGVCTDTTVLHLTVRRSTMGVENIVVCDSLVWNGTMYYSSTDQPTRVISGGNRNGCDSTVRLMLTVNHGVHETYVAEACDGYEWTSTGMSYTETGVYVRQYVSVEGCASADTLSLTIHKSTRDTVMEDVCDEYFWIVDGRTYRDGGRYVNRTEDVYGCEVEHVLELTLRKGTYRMLNERVCESYLWEPGMRLFEESIEGEVLYYYNEEGCRSVDTLWLTVYGYKVPQERTLVEKKHKGAKDPWMLIYPRKDGDDEYYYQWYRNGEPLEGANEQFLELSGEASGTTVNYAVWVANRNVAECSSYSSKDITFQGTKELKVTSFPNPAHGDFMITLSDGSTAGRGSVEILSEQGKLMLTMPLEGGEARIDEMLPSGVYVIRVTMEDGTAAVGKVVVK